MSSNGKGAPDPRERDRHRAPVRRFLVPAPLPQPLNPALLKHSEEYAEKVQNRVADKITPLPGSMTLLYIDVLWFGFWIGLGAEKYPYGLLTMIVSLEAIFLSTFVTISQNRADAKRQAIADPEWKTVQTEDTRNQQLLDLSKQILGLTRSSGPGGHRSNRGQAESRAARPLQADARAHQASQIGTRVSRSAPSLAPQARWARPRQPGSRQKGGVMFRLIVTGVLTGRGVLTAGSGEPATAGATP